MPTPKRRTTRTRFQEAVTRNLLGGKTVYPRTSWFRNPMAIIRATLEAAGIKKEDKGLRRLITRIMLKPEFSQRNNPDAEKLYKQILIGITALKGDETREKFIQALETHLIDLNRLKEDYKKRN